jgi:hypothetical protein
MIFLFCLSASSADQHWFGRESADLPTAVHAGGRSLHQLSVMADVLNNAYILLTIKSTDMQRPSSHSSLAVYSKLNACVDFDKQILVACVHAYPHLLSSLQTSKDLLRIQTLQCTVN